MLSTLHPGQVGVLYSNLIINLYIYYIDFKVLLASWTLCPCPSVFWCMSMIIFLFEVFGRPLVARVHSHMLQPAQMTPCNV